MSDFDDIHEARAALDLAINAAEFECCQRYINFYFSVLHQLRQIAYA